MLLHPPTAIMWTGWTPASTIRVAQVCRRTWGLK